MWYYVKKYPLSLIVLLAVIYFSFFNPASTNVPRFPGFDKVAHFCMYAGLSGILWVEHLWNHRNNGFGLRRGLIGATILPILWGGLMEIGQHFLTTTRQGDILDFVANSLGSITATLIAWYLIRPLIKRKTQRSGIKTP